MLQFLDKTPTFILCSLSILPLVFIGLSPDLWAYLNIFLLCFFALWIFSITKLHLNKNVYDKNLKFPNFTLVLLFTTLYLLFLSIYFAQTFGSDNKPAWFPLLILVGHSLLLYSVYYLLNFIAKTIATINKKKVVKFSDYSNYFFLLLVFPIGIWWLHPKIKLATSN